jgi:general secretion pathway protein G
MRSLVRGFSLVEILVTAGAVSLACAVALPGVTSYVDQARANRAINDLSTTAIRIHKWRTRTGEFPESLAEAGIAIPNDPWGRPYIYRRLTDADPTVARSHRARGKLNSDFDLYSVGPDGETATSCVQETALSSVQQPTTEHAGNEALFSAPLARYGTGDPTRPTEARPPNPAFRSSRRIHSLLARLWICVIRVCRMHTRASAVVAGEARQHAGWRPSRSVRMDCAATPRHCRGRHLAPRRAGRTPRHV